MVSKRSKAALVLVGGLSLLIGVAALATRVGGSSSFPPFLEQEGGALPQSQDFTPYSIIVPTSGVSGTGGQGPPEPPVIVETAGVAPNLPAGFTQVGTTIYGPSNTTFLPLQSGGFLETTGGVVQLPSDVGGINPPITPTDISAGLQSAVQLAGQQPVQTQQQQQQPSQGIGSNLISLLGTVGAITLAGLQGAVPIGSGLLSTSAQATA